MPESDTMPPSTGAVPVSGVRTLIDADAIARRVEELAGAIAQAMPTDLTLIVLLKGSFVFAADLARALGRAGLEPYVDFLRLASYGAGRESSGAVQVVGGMPAGLEGRRVLVVEDIADSGRTLDLACGLLTRAGAAEVRVCALLDKPSRRVVPVPVDFVGFTIEDLFVVGYGIDYAERYRYLPHIGVVD